MPIRSESEQSSNIPAQAVSVGSVICRNKQYECGNSTIELQRNQQPSIAPRGRRLTGGEPQLLGGRDYAPETSREEGGCRARAADRRSGLDQALDARRLGRMRIGEDGQVHYRGNHPGGPTARCSASRLSERMRGVLWTASRRRTVASVTPACWARVAADHPSTARPARICKPVITRRGSRMATLIRAFSTRTPGGR